MSPWGLPSSSGIVRASGKSFRVKVSVGSLALLPTSCVMLGTSRNSTEPLLSSQGWGRFGPGLVGSRVCERALEALKSSVCGCHQRSWGRKGPRRAPSQFTAGKTEARRAQVIAMATADQARPGPQTQDSRCSGPHWVLGAWNDSGDPAPQGAVELPSSGERVPLPENPSPSSQRGGNRREKSRVWGPGLCDSGGLGWVM